ncbi:MAG: hypothetical protein N3B12_08805, partial [Armatimonadetes bacterium]|nr:hypothetical protein [Armatimonadota bacterium]
YIASDLRTMLANNERYRPFLYRDKLAPIERAKVDNVLKTPDTAPPFAEDKAKTLKLAQILATDFFLVGEIDDLQVDRTNRVAQITLRAELYDGKTGKLVKAFLVTGRTPDSVKTGEEDELRDLAKGVAVTKLIAEFTAPGSEEAGSVPDKSSESAKPASGHQTSPDAQGTAPPAGNPGR